MPATGGRCVGDPLAQSDGNEQRPGRAYARRSRSSERVSRMRHRRHAASTSPDARRPRRAFGWCRTICTACRPSTMIASPASTVRGERWWRRSPTSSSRAVSSTTASRASAATPARTTICSRSSASAATSARVATPNASRSGRSGWTRRSSRPSRTGRSVSRFRSGCVPAVSIGAACSATSPASPPAPSRRRFADASDWRTSAHRSDRPRSPCGRAI